MSITNNLIKPLVKGLLKGLTYDIKQVQLIQGNYSTNDTKTNIYYVDDAKTKLLVVNADITNT